ncbi:hypothetical protein Scep_017419 [Stephania cephalantha]|uniref:Reverse transcriptase zinc-binding domain-containing protein n=1 Tax=Stephania cephalantha TaxID=152367 RepID=A0AAP0IRA1_9MAGN
MGAFLVLSSRCEAFARGILSGWQSLLQGRDLLVKDARVITSIPLRQNSYQDRLVWHYIKLGVYIVKSRYRLANRELEELKKSGHSSSSTTTLLGTEQKGWNKIWKLPCPPKVKIFIWKCLHDLIPINEFRVRRKIANKSLCPMCLDDQETLIHLLFLCTHVSRFWLASPLGLDTSRIQGNTFKDIWTYIVKVIEERAVDEGLWTWFTMGLWQLWKRM